MPRAAVRLSGIIARAAPVAVVFRRGPSRQVELLRWDLANDEIQRGQWLKGRIYERRSDLSPDGSLLVYFAGKYQTEMRTWTAISRPPYLTALALWPKGDAWGGGALFKTDRHLLLNHKPHEMTPDPDHAPHGLRVTPLEPVAGHGEDDPIHHLRLTRDGWQFVDNGARPEYHANQGPMWITFDPPIQYRRPQLRRSGAGSRPSLVLESSLDVIHERGGPWYVMRYRILDGDRVVRDLGQIDWADWTADGDLLSASRGRLWRLGSEDVPRSDSEPREIADLRSDRFESRAAPPEATAW